MQQSPIYIFEDTTSVGVSSVPISGLIIVRNDGTNKPIVITKTGEAGNDDIASFLASGDYQEFGFDTKSQLERIVEGGNTGWRILDRDPTKYGDIGEEAIDFSDSTSASGSNGATGDSSFAANRDNIASGEASFASGLRTTAGGNASFTSGVGTLAPEKGAAAFGKYNTGDKKFIFEVGGGVDGTHRDNFFEIDHSCNMLRAPLTDVAAIDDITIPGHERNLITKEYLDQYTGRSNNLNALDDVVVTPVPASFGAYAGSTHYYKDDFVTVAQGTPLVTKNYVCLVGYTSNANGDVPQFKIDRANGHWAEAGPNVNENHLLVYNPKGGTPGGLGEWENIEDLDMGYY